MAAEDPVLRDALNTALDTKATLGESTIDDLASQAVAAAAAERAKTGRPAREHFHADGETEHAFHDMVDRLADPSFQKMLDQTMDEIKQGTKPADGAGGTSFDAAATTDYADLEMNFQQTVEVCAHMLGAASAAGLCMQARVTVTPSGTVRHAARGASSGPQLMQKLGMSEESQQAAGDMADATMTEIMKEFESMGQKSEYVRVCACDARHMTRVHATVAPWTCLLSLRSFGAVVDNMMKQLLTKDIMYEPVKEITEKVCTDGSLHMQAA